MKCYEVFFLNPFQVDFWTLLPAPSCTSKHFDHSRLLNILCILPFLFYVQISNLNLMDLIITVESFFFLFLLQSRDTIQGLQLHHPAFHYWWKKGHIGFSFSSLYVFVILNKVLLNGVYGLTWSFPLWNNMGLLRTQMTQFSTSTNIQHSLE